MPKNLKRLLILMSLAALASVPATAAQVQVPQASTSETPAVMTFNSELYIVYRNSVGSLSYQHTPDGVNWSAPQSIPGVGAALGGPALAIFNRQLQVAYKTTNFNGQSDVFKVAFDPSLKLWGQVTPVPAVAPVSIGGDPDMSLGPDGRLYVLWKKSGSQQLYYSSTSDDFTWSAAAQAPSCSSDSGPGSFAYNGKLRMVFRGVSEANSYRALDINGSWGPAPVKIGGSTSHEPGATVHNNLFYIVYKGQSTDNIYYRTLNTLDQWSAQFQLSVSQTSKGPSATSFLNQLWICYKSFNTSNVYCNPQ